MYEQLINQYEKDFLNLFDLRSSLKAIDKSIDKNLKDTLLSIKKALKKKDKNLEAILDKGKERLWKKLKFESKFLEETKKDSSKIDLTAELEDEFEQLSHSREDINYIIEEIEAIFTQEEKYILDTIHYFKTKLVQNLANMSNSEENNYELNDICEQMSESTQEITEKANGLIKNIVKRDKINIKSKIEKMKKN